MQEEGEGAGDGYRVQPYEDDLHLRVSPAAVGLARDFRVRAEEAVEIEDDVAADEEHADEERGEDDLNDVAWVVLHMSEWEGIVAPIITFYVPQRFRDRFTEEIGPGDSSV